MGQSCEFGFSEPIAFAAIPVGADPDLNAVLLWERVYPAKALAE